MKNGPVDTIQNVFILSMIKIMVIYKLKLMGLSLETAKPEDIEKVGEDVILEMFSEIQHQSTIFTDFLLEKLEGINWTLCDRQILDKIIDKKK